MEGNMQQSNRDGASADHEQKRCKIGGIDEPDFAEELLPGDEEMLEKDLSELDNLGLGFEEFARGHAARLPDAAACLSPTEEMTAREPYVPTSPAYSKSGLHEDIENRAANKKRRRRVVDPGHDKGPSPTGRRHTKRTLQLQSSTREALPPPMPISERAAGEPALTCPSSPNQPMEVDEGPQRISPVVPQGAGEYGLHDPSQSATFLLKRRAEEATRSEGGASQSVRRLEVAPPTDALTGSPTSLPAAARSPPSMSDAASSERCVERSDEPQTLEGVTGSGAPNLGGADLSMREPSLRHADEGLQWEWETFGPPPEPVDDGDLDWDLEDEFKDKCIITLYPRRESGTMNGNRAEGELRPPCFSGARTTSSDDSHNIVAEEDSPLMGGVRAASVEAESSADSSCDSGPLTITMAAERFRELGYPVFSVDITWDHTKNKKSVKFPTSWQTSTIASGTVREGQNCLAINTTTCDLLGLDIDVQDEGMAAWEALQHAHGPVDAPSVRTGSGGGHRYFSHIKSIAAGLSERIPTTFSKLYVDLDTGDGAVSKVGIDLRGKGKASCLIAPGSSYVDGTGARVGYELLDDSELPPTNDLPPLPGWLVDILNRQKSLKAAWDEQERKKEAERRAGGASAGTRGRRTPEPASASSEPDLASPELQREVVRALQALLSTWGDNTSVFSDAKPSSTGVGVIYNFRNGPKGRMACPYFAAACGGVHDSNNFALMRRGAEVTYLCYGESCKTASRTSAIRLDKLHLPIAAAFGDSQPLNSERNHLYADRTLFPLSFLRDNLSVMKGDVGCAIILERLYLRTGLKLAVTPSGSYYWDGLCWAKDESGGHIMRVLREELTKIQTAYIQDNRKGNQEEEAVDIFDGLESVEEDGERGVEDAVSNPSTRSGTEKGKKEEKLVNVNFNAKMSNVVSTCKEYFFQADFQSLLDAQKDFRAAANGVIDLRSGELLPHHPRFMNSQVIKWPYPACGVSHPRGDMVKFLENVMHLSGEDGLTALEHLQVLLGYGLTGHTSNQVLAIFVGEGSAGKSLLLALLRKLLGHAYRDVRKEIVVNAKGQRAANKGAASPLEAGLAGALLAVVEETEKSDTLDEAGMKKLTGSDVITARPLFKDFITFTATVLLILCTNYLPKTDKTWSVALRRRLQLVCFIKRYFSPHENGYDPENPLHGAVDTRLLDKLTTEPNMQELLAWLVAGAVKWYKNGQQLYRMPKRSEDALREYEEENDDFEAFVRNSCIVGENLFISTKEALEVYHNPQRMVDGAFVSTCSALNNKTLKVVMNNHGYDGPGKPSELKLGGEYTGSQERGYRGLALKPQGQFLGETVK